MTAQQYIEKRLNELKTYDGELINFASKKELTDFVYKSVMSKKFRKYSVDEEYQKHIYSAIEINIANNEPIKFTLAFGGYKLWRLKEAPEADWAELFTLIYFMNWLKPIAANYEPGVWFDFSSDNVIIERMNNIPKRETDLYQTGFLRLLDYFKNFIPSNVSFTFTPVSSRYTQAEFDRELKEKIEVVLKENKGLPSVSEKEAAMIDLNVKLHSGQENDPKWRQRIQLIHNAYLIMDKRRPYFRTKDKIMVVATKFPNSLPLGTTKTSVAKFWAGVGALKRLNDNFIECVLSPTQIESTKNEWEQISFDGLSGKNFNKIRII